MERRYLQRQLEIFRDGLRGTHPEDLIGQEMYPMAQALPDAQVITDIVSFINTLGR